MTQHDGTSSAPPKRGQDQEELPRELIWGDDGHLSEIALTALADGEDAIIPADAHAHAAGCEGCGRALGEAAMLSMALGKALRDMPARREASLAPAPAAAVAAPVSSKADVKMPWRAIFAGLTLALVGAIPMLLRAPALLDWARFLSSRGAPMLLHGAVAVMQRAGGPAKAALVLTCASALVLVSFAALVARQLPLAKSGGSEGASR